MRFLRIVIFLTSILFCQRVDSTLNSVLENQLLSYDDGKNLEQFFVELNTVLEKGDHWLQIVVARSDEDLRNSKPLFQTNPYVICLNIENCEYPDDFFQAEILAVIFLNDLSNGKIKKYSKLFLNRKSKVLFVFDQRADKNAIASFILDALRGGVPMQIEFAHLNEGSLDLYTPVSGEICTPEIILDMVWKAGADLSKLNFFNFIKIDFKECLVPVSVNPTPQKMILEKEKDGSLRIAGGQTGEIIKAIADHLNFKILLRTPSNETWHTRSSDIMSVIDDTITGSATIGIGGFRPTNVLSKNLTFSSSYDMECLTWGVPRMNNYGGDNIIWAEFEWKVWVGIGLMFVFACLTEYLYDNYIDSFLGIGNRGGNDFMKNVLNTLLINLGSPAIGTAIRASGRIIFITFTFYATVMTTGYKTSLASILATVRSRPLVTDTEGIVKANFIVGGSEYNLNILKDQINSSEYIPKLIERYVVIRDSTVAIERLKSEKNFAFLGRRSFLLYSKRKAVEARELIKFDILDECILNFHVVMILKENTVLVESVNRYILQLLESGIVNHWNKNFRMNDQILEKQNSELYVQKFMRQKFKDIFIFYGCGIVLSILVFFIELICPKISSIKRWKPRVRRG